MTIHYSSTPIHRAFGFWMLDSGCGVRRCRTGGSKGFFLSAFSLRPFSLPLPITCTCSGETVRVTERPSARTCRFDPVGRQKDRQKNALRSNGDGGVEAVAGDGDHFGLQAVDGRPVGLGGAPAGTVRAEWPRGCQPVLRGLPWVRQRSPTCAVLPDTVAGKTFLVPHEAGHEGGGRPLEDLRYRSDLLQAPFAHTAPARRARALASVKSWVTMSTVMPVSR